MKTKIFIKQVILLINMSCFFISCEKEYLPDCTSGNCVNTNIKGSLYVKPTGEKLSNILVEVSFVYKNTMWFVVPHKVVSGKTDKNGIFNFNVTIDTTYFKEYSLWVRIPQLENYISVHNISLDYISMWFYDYDADVLQNIHFEFYKKAILTINLNRTQMDDFDYFYLSYSYDGNIGFYAITMPDLKFTTNEIFQLETAADIYTTIWWTKRLKEETIDYKTDSLICKQNRDNIFNLNY